MSEFDVLMCQTLHILRLALNYVASQAYMYLCLREERLLHIIEAYIVEPTPLVLSVATLSQRSAILSHDGRITIAPVKRCNIRYMEVSQLEYLSPYQTVNKSSWVVKAL